MDQHGPPRSDVAVLIPVKPFGRAKGRLAGALGASARQNLARRLAGQVLAAASPLAVTVVCDDDEVAAWAAARGAATLRQTRPGLDAAVADGVAHLSGDGVSRVVVAHADLPLARELGWVAAFAGVTIVPDRRDDGTNVIALPASAGFRFAYGPGSFRRHAAEARRLGLALRVVRDPALGWDVDLPEDLAAETGEPLRFGS